MQHSITGADSSVPRFVQGRLGGTVLNLLHCAVHTGNAFQNFRVRTVLLIAVVGVLLCFPVAIAEYLAGRTAVALFALCCFCVQAAAASAIVFFDRVELAINSVLATLLCVFFGLMWFQQGVALGFYVGLSVLLFLISTLARWRSAICLWLVAIGMLVVATYMSHAHWHTAIDMRDPIVAMSGFKMALGALCLNLLVVLVFRDATHNVIADFSNNKRQVARLNERLQQELADKHAVSRTLGQFGEAGISVVWYYDTGTGLLRHSEPLGANNHEPKVGEIPASAFPSLDAMGWQAQLINIVADSDALPELNRELRCVDPQTRDFRWYAMSASTHRKENGYLQVCGILRDITAKRQSPKV